MNQPDPNIWNVWTAPAEEVEQMAAVFRENTRTADSILECLRQILPERDDSVFDTH